MACPPDACEGAVREVAKVYELIKTHQPLFLLHDHDHHHPQLQGQQTELAQSLLSEALRALNMALSAMTAMRQQQNRGSSSATATAAPMPLAVTPPELISLSATTGPAAEPSASQAADHSRGATASTFARSGKRKRSSVTTEGGKKSSWVNLTPNPNEDSYDWRKYGEKKINGTRFTRSYFRCAYRDDKGCLATKYVQQKEENSYPPVFQVTYNNVHTCNCTAAAATSSSSAAQKNNNCCNNDNLPPTGAATSNPPIIIGGHHAVMIMEQAEATTLVLPPPPPADVPAVPLYDQIMPFSIGDCSYVTAGVAVGDISSLVGVSCNELDIGHIMSEPLIGHDPDELQDSELHLLYNSFKYY